MIKISNFLFLTTLNEYNSGKRENIKKGLTAVFPDFDVLSYEKIKIFVSCTNRIRQLSVCCHGYTFTVVTNISTTSVSVTESIHLRLLFMYRSYPEIFFNPEKLLLVTYLSQNSKIKKISPLKNLVNF